jgi:poly(3-hydroxybutyrate) depolymerase
MHHALRGACAILVLCLATVPLLAQEAGAAGARYRIYAPAGQATSLLVLLPGYGDDADGFDPSSGSTPSTLPARLAEQGVVTVVAVPRSDTLYETDKALGARVVAEHGLPRERVAIGGFSAGGTGAVRYAQLCTQHKCRAVARIAAVFAVDPPLDFERLYRASGVIVQRNAPRSNIAEERMILETLRGSLGGTPDGARESYRIHSAVTASDPRGGTPGSS